MGSLVKVYDSFLSEEILKKIESTILNLNEKEYGNVKNKFPWLSKEIVKEKNVIKYSERETKINFSELSKEIRSNIAIKSGINDQDTQVHFDKGVYLNIVIPIFMRDVKQSGLIIFPYFSSLLLRPFVKYSLTQKFLRKLKFLRNFLKVQDIDYKPNNGYIFRGYDLAHGVFYRPLSNNSLRAVLTINFKKF